MEPDAAPCCPACGYQRTGIAPGARCPECGADGLEGCLVISGTRRSAYSIALGLLLFDCGAIMLVSLRMASRGEVPVASIALLMTFIVVAAALVAAMSGKFPGLVALRPRTIVWTVHPAGIEVRDGSSRWSIRRGEISRIDCAHSVIGPVSQLSIVRSRMTAGGVLGTTPILYIRGSMDDRRAILRAACEALSLHRPR